MFGFIKKGCERYLQQCQSDILGPDASDEWDALIERARSMEPSESEWEYLGPGAKRAVDAPMGPEMVFSSLAEAEEQQDAKPLCLAKLERGEAGKRTEIRTNLPPPPGAE